MAGIGASLRGQYAAVAEMRWRMFLNSLRTRRGGFEVGARIAMQGFFALIGLGVGISLGMIAWQMASHESLRHLAVLLWPVLVFWQLVPITIASFQENADLSIFLRFPIDFGSYVLFYILFGLFDVGSLVGGIGLLGIWIGASVAQPGLIVGITLTLALFALFNILLTRMIFAWIDRWLAQRKTREVLGAAFLFLMLGAQLLNPALHEHRRHEHSIFAIATQSIHAAKHVQGILPPGLAANAIANAHAGTPFAAAADMFFLALFASAAGSLLGIRLRSEYRGESLGEAPSRAAKVAHATHQRGLLEGSGPIAAVIEKEVRYLTRSGIMLYGFLAPLFIVFVFSGRPHGTQAPGFAGEYALPLGVAYTFLGLTRFIYNNLGGEGAGIQIYFLSPTPFRKVMLAKNIVHSMIFLVELVLVCIIVAYRSGLPSPRMMAVTFCWLLFALPLQLAIGNVLSITMAYRMNMTRMSREQGAAGNGLLSLFVEVFVFAVGAAIYALLGHIGHANLAAPALLILALGSVLFWLRILSRSEKLVQARKESLIANLCRAA